jgi:POT family proton-dependent oligopeptide transporter
MEKIQSQNHTKETLYYSISKILERASYYGLRSLLVLYMFGETMKLKGNEATTIYGWFTASLIFSQIIGGLLGDLLIGNKKSIIIGGIVQAIGAFSLCIPSTAGLYIGLFLVVLGSGFFTPNIVSNFGKLYLNKIKLLDSGFTLFYLATNLGSFLGVLCIGYTVDNYGYNIGFILSGLLILISLIPILISKEQTSDEFEINKFSINTRILNISIAFIVVGLFWFFYEMSNIRTLDIQFQLSKILAITIPEYLWQSLNSILIFPISLIAIILWTYFYNSQFFKLTLGFIFGVLSFGILFLIPEAPNEQHVIMYLISLLFLGIAEIHISPIIHSVLTKNSNPKYLAILTSLVFLPTRLISLIFGLFNGKLYENPILGLKIGLIGMAVVGIGLIGYIIWNQNYRQQRV